MPPSISASIFRPDFEGGRILKSSVIVIGLVLAAGAVRPAAAIEVPQNRKEFVVAVSGGARGTVTETIVVDRGFAKVYSSLKEKTAVCLDVTVNRRANVGYLEISSSDYNPTLRMAGGNRAEFALQAVHRPRGVGHTPPPGGLYMMAADIRSVGPNRTEVVLYAPKMGFKKITNAFKRWVAGEDADCPRMP